MNGFPNHDCQDEYAVCPGCREDMNQKPKSQGGKKIIALFGYPMDNSVRAKVFEDMPSVYAEAEKWKSISYLIIAFEVQGETFILNYES